MKKKLLSFMALLAITGTAMAQNENSLSVADINLPQNAESPLVVSFQFDVADTYTGYQFNLELPSDLEFVLEEGTDVACEKGTCHDASHSVTANLKDGLVKVAGLSLSSKPLVGTSGVLLTFTIKPSSPSLEIGHVYTGKIKDIVLVPVEGVKQNLTESTFTITIGEPADTRTVLDETSTAAPEAATGVDIRVKRSIKANQWSTICLPFDMSEAQVKEAFGDDVKLADFDGIESTYADEDESIVTAIKVKFNTVSSIEANHPYIIKVSAPISEFTVDGVDIVVEEEPSVDKDEYRTGSGTKKDPYVYHYNSFVGSYVCQTAVPEYCLFLSENIFWYSTGATMMKGFRGYFDFYDVLSEVEEAGARILVSVDEGETTGIANANVNLNANENYFNLNGQQVTTPKHGVFIKGGKKVVVK